LPLWGGRGPNQGGGGGGTTTPLQTTPHGATGDRGSFPLAKRHRFPGGEPQFFRPATECYRKKQMEKKRVPIWGEKGPTWRPRRHKKGCIRPGARNRRDEVKYWKNNAQFPYPWGGLLRWTNQGPAKPPTEKAGWPWGGSRKKTGLGAKKEKRKFAGNEKPGNLGINRFDKCSAPGFPLQGQREPGARLGGATEKGKQKSFN